jgi:hypothetical protein
MLVIEREGDGVMVELIINDGCDGDCGIDGLKW